MRAFLRRHATALRWLALGLAAGLALLAFRVLDLAPYVERATAWIDGLGVFGPVVFAAVYAIAVVLLVPGSLLTLAAGAAFGLWVGVVTVSAGATLGATGAFLVARHLARSRIEALARTKPKFQALDAAIEESGWRTVALLRLSPALPFSFSNYAFGLTGVDTRGYVLATWLGTLPGTFVYVYLGYLGRTTLEGAERSTLEWALLVVGLVATIAVTAWLTVLARRKLRELEGPCTDEDAHLST